MARITNIVVMRCLCLLGGAILLGFCLTATAAAVADDRIPFRDKGSKKWGYVDSSDRQIIPAQFDNAYPFYEGLARIEVDRKIGFIDEDGHVAIAPFGSKVMDFREGRARVSAASRGGWGYIDSQGQLVIEPQYRSAYDFNDGLALVKTTAGDLRYIDRHGRVAIATGETFSINYESVFSEGLAVARDNSLGLWGYIDTNGVFAIPAGFRAARRFGDGLAAVCLPGPEEYAKWGYINTKGEWVIRPQFGVARPFFEGYAEVVFGTATSDRTYALIDSHGDLITSKQASPPHLPGTPSAFEPYGSGSVRIAAYTKDGINEVWSELCAYVEKEYGLARPMRPNVKESFWNYRTTGIPRADYRVKICMTRNRTDVLADVLAVYFRGYDGIVGTDSSVKRKLEKEFGVLVPSNDSASSKAAVSSSPDRTSKSPVVDTARPARSMQDKVASITIPTVTFIDANMRDVVEFLDGYAKQNGAHITLNVHRPSAVPGISYEGRFVTLLEAIRGVTDAAGLQYRITDDSVVIESAAEPVRDKPIGVIQKAPIKNGTE